MKRPARFALIIPLLSAFAALSVSAVLAEEPPKKPSSATQSKANGAPRTGSQTGQGKPGSQNGQGKPGSHANGTGKPESHANGQTRPPEPSGAPGIVVPLTVDAPAVICVGPLCIR